MAPGTIFGKWTIVSPGPNLGRHTRSICECTCGIIRNVINSRLITGGSISCGCCNGTAYEIRRKRYTTRNRDFVDGYKAAPCTDCGHTYPPECMDFDHIDPTTKRCNVAALSNNSIDAILAEIQKCELVCANCHRIRTVKHARRPKHYGSKDL